MGEDKRRRSPSHSPPPRRDDYERDRRIAHEGPRDRDRGRDRAREYDRDAERDRDRDLERDGDRGRGSSGEGREGRYHQPRRGDDYGERDRGREEWGGGSDRGGRERPSYDRSGGAKRERERERGGDGPAGGEEEWAEPPRSRSGGVGGGGGRGDRSDAGGGGDDGRDFKRERGGAGRGDWGGNGGRGGGGRGGRGRGGGRDAESGRYMSQEEREAKEREAEEAAKPKAPKEQPNLGLSGKLAAEANKVAGGTELKHVPPAEARKPDKKWRLYIFKNDQLQDEPFRIHRMDHYLFGRDVGVADIVTAHPSCSKQHAVLQFRLTQKNDEFGLPVSAVRPYLLDLGSVNGTFLNGERMEPLRYYELLEKDVVRFGLSTREYVLLHEKSGDE